MNWSETEKKAAQVAWQRAKERETGALLQEIRSLASAIAELDEVWHLHSFLSAKRHDLDGKYDDRDSVLISVLARLLKEGWLHLDELEGLDKDKLAKVTALART